MQGKWLIVDELYDERKDVVSEELSLGDDWFSIEHCKIGKDKDKFCNLASAYQFAIEQARDYGADLFLSIQDYIWFPKTTVRQFAIICQQHNCLATALCHHAAEPTAKDISYWDGLITIFDRRWDGERPKGLSWHDVRKEGNGSPYVIEPVRWETNVAAVAKGPLFDERLSFDPDYDNHIAYENQDYACKAERNGYDIMMVEGVEALSFPHRLYWPEETAEYDRECRLNLYSHHRKWGLSLPDGMSYSDVE